MSLLATDDQLWKRKLLALLRGEEEASVSAGKGTSEIWMLYYKRVAMYVHLRIG